MSFEEDSFQESEAVRKLMKLMSDRPNKSPSPVFSKHDSDRHAYKLEQGHSITRQLASRNEISTDNDNVLRRAERMRREVEITLDSMRRQRSRVQTDSNSKDTLISDEQPRYNSRSFPLDRSRNSDDSHERRRSGA